MQEIKLGLFVLVAASIMCGSVSCAPAPAPQPREVPPTDTPTPVAPQPPPATDTPVAPPAAAAAATYTPTSVAPPPPAPTATSTSTPAPVTLVSLVDGETRPNLAEAWEVSEDGLRWIFLLAEGWEMSDGTPYTSDIVEQTLNEEGYRRIKGYAGSQKLDDYTIELLLETPNPDFLREISQIELPQ